MAFSLNPTTWFKKQKNNGGTSRPASNQSSIGVTRNYGGMQGGNVNLQGSSPNLQPTVNPFNVQTTSPTLQEAATTTTGGGVGGGSYAANAAAAASLQNQQNDIRNRVNALMGAYDTLTGKANTYYTDQANQLRQQYGGARTKVGDTLKQTSNTLTGAYQARGLGDSSFAANAQNAALTNYNTDITNLGTQETAGLGKIGSAYETAKAKYDAAKNTYQDYINRLGSYSAADLSALSSNLNSDLQNVASQQGQLGTQAENIQALQNLGPAAAVGSSEIQKFLTDLQNSGTTSIAKNTLGKAYIAQATGNNPEQQSYWTDYFNNLKTTGKV